ncbi:Pyridoxamine 5'-phosphate oxidase [Roseovarius albus]|uniref:Pyridoxamine 5'-phosphate oxidase n=1 Tax=Roseovarius albus TaxID=1247867 RepID=A0A1X6YSE0_9RHOB|nr:pyridoxamine 5'-phosphate oxidase family protein [Roseovarius albus]SLN29256.1 Pyridoxamine 5'-phosphate oxidase [Roseovarius albus]
MQWIEDVENLEALYGQPPSAAIRKVATRLTPLYRKWIMASRFCVLTTVGPGGTDGSPRGDDGPVVTELDEQTLAMPDWRGNNRLDSLRNIVSDGRVSLMFIVPGLNTIVRLNGQAKLTEDADLRARFEHKARQPTTVIVIRIGEIYTQCARAPMRAGLWSRDDSEGLPTVGEILAEQTDGEEGGETYDTEWGPRAAKTMW